MFIKKLIISNNNGIIRDIVFHRGLNLIVDNTVGGNTETGNNIGKTTVLRLVDFCLGKKQNVIYADPANMKAENKTVKDFLIDTNVEVTLVLTKNFGKDDVIIRRNFLSHSKAVRQVNGEQIKESEFEKVLEEKILGIITDKPTFRQIISHNIRYTNQSVDNILKTLDKYTQDPEYETLYLFMFGCNTENGAKKQELINKIKAENTFKTRLERDNDKATLSALLGMVNNNIELLENQKKTLNLNPHFEEEMDELSSVKYQINKVASECNALKLKRDLIIEAKTDIENDRSDIDFQQLSSIYEQAKAFVPKLEHTFEELVSFHNSMIEKKVKFICNSLPGLESQIRNLKVDLSNLLRQEEKLSLSISKSSSYEELEALISDLNNLYNKKGEYEASLKQIEDVEEAIEVLSHKLSVIDEKATSKVSQDKVQQKINDFNSYFSSISERLYGESYALRQELVTYRKTGHKIYQFSSFNANLSSGKKLGEMTCFDIAYDMFARKKNIPHVDFVMHDKNELMSDNQLIGIAKIVEENDVQFIAPILKDKLPDEMDNEKFYILHLSQHDKLFRIP